MCNNKRFLSSDSLFVLCLIPILPPTSMTDYYPTDLSSVKNTAFYYHNAIHNFKKGISFGTKGKKAKNMCTERVAYLMCVSYMICSSPGPVLLHLCLQQINVKFTH